jgi:hypothetical protein
MIVYFGGLSVFKDGHSHNLQEEHHSGRYYQAFIQMSVGPFWDTTDHHLQSGQQIPQHILVKSLITVGHQAH